MSTASSRRAECLYWLLAAIGLFGSQAQLPAYLPLGFFDGTVEFWKDALASPAGRFLVVDIFVLGSAFFVWMFGEARRLGMRRAWLYLAASLLIAISIFVPVFMAMRERRLRDADAAAASSAWRLAGTDWLGVALLLAMCLLAAAYSLAHIPVWRAA